MYNISVAVLILNEPWWMNNGGALFFFGIILLLLLKWDFGIIVFIGSNSNNGCYNVFVDCICLDLSNFVCNLLLHVW